MDPSSGDHVDGEEQEARPEASDEEGDHNVVDKQA